MRRRALKRRAGLLPRCRRRRPLDDAEEQEVDLTFEAIMAGGGKGSVS
jgi:hypothetical protein